MLAVGLPVSDAECLLLDFRSAADQLSSDAEPRGFLCLHATLPKTPTLETVRALWGVVRDRQGRSQTAGRVTSWLVAAGSPGIKVDASQPYYTIVFSGLEDASVLPPVTDGGSAFGQWDALRQWTWLLASLTPPEYFAPVATDTDTGIELSLSTTLFARVLRDGTAFVARERTTTGVRDPSVSSLRFYVRTIYLDALLLGLLQRHSLNELADRIGSVAIRQDQEINVIEGFDKDLSRFRASLWWRAAAWGSHGDKLITAFQEENRLPELLSNSTIEVAELVRQARTGVEQATLASARRTERVVTLLTVVALPSVPILSVWQGVSGKWRGLPIALVVYLVVALALYTALRAAQRRRQ
jgi:hypothetical protein